MSTALPPIALPVAAPSPAAPGEPVRAPSGDDRDFDVALELAAASLAAKPPTPLVVTTSVAPAPAVQAADAATALALELADAPVAPDAVVPERAAAPRAPGTWADLVRASNEAAGRAVPNGAKPFAIDAPAPSPAPAPVAADPPAPSADGASARPPAPPPPAAPVSGTDVAQDFRVLSSSEGTRVVRPPVADGNDVAPLLEAPDSETPADPASPTSPARPAPAASAAANAAASAAREAVLRASIAAAGSRVLDDSETPAPVIESPAAERGACAEASAAASPAPAVAAEGLARLGRLLEHVRAVLARAVSGEPEGSGASAPAEPLPATPERRAAPTTFVAPPANATAVPATAPAPAATPATVPAAAPAKAPATATAPASAAASAVASAAAAKGDGVDPDAARRDGDPAKGQPSRASAEAAPAEAPAASAAGVAPAEARGANANESVARPNGVRAAPVVSAPELPAANPGERVTLRFEGEGGVSGRIRLSMRGETLHATIVPSGPGFESAGNLDELRRMLADRGFAEARVAVQEAVLQTGLPSGSPSSQGPPRDDARREAFARAHEERGQSESQGRPGRQRPRHPEEEKP